jgi:host factor-I protein
VVKYELARSERELAQMQKTQNLQDTFLNQMRRDRAVITVFLMNGFQFRGVVKGFDAFTVVLDTDGKQQLIYKHAISTLVPPKPVELRLDGDAAT